MSASSIFPDLFNRFKDLTGHRRSSPENLRKKNSIKTLSALDCLARAVGMNTAPSGIFLYHFRVSLIVKVVSILTA